MVNKLKIGDYVTFLDEIGKGCIKDILNANQAIVLTDDGFEVTYQINKLILVSEDNYSEEAFKSNISFQDLSKYQKKSKSKFENNKTWEVDLHIENIIDYTKNLSNYDIINKQINYCNSVVEKAIKNNISKLIIIHGRGEGVLKEEVLQLLKKYNVKTKDANFKKYGLGATEVIFI